MTLTPSLARLHRDERGIALAIAIFALVIIATLISGVFFMARLEQRSGNNALWSTQAQEAANAGVNTALANWSGTYNSMANGASQTLATVTLPGNTSRYTTTVMKVSNQIFLVSSKGERTNAAGGVLSGTSVGRLVRMVVPDVTVESAVTANGPVTLQGNLTVDGRNTNPPGWPVCAVATDTVASVQTSQSIKASGSYTAIGKPSPEGLVENDASVTASRFVDPYNALRPFANVTHTGAWSPSDSPRPIASSGVCVQDFRNWGEPWRNPPVSATVGACTNYSPIIWINNPGSEARVSGGRGQGILLVAGDLEMSGGFEFTGIIIVLGGVRTTGMGAKVTGALMAQNQAVSDITYIGGTPVVTYSSCAITQALLGAARAQPLGERSWVQLY